MTHRGKLARIFIYHSWIAIEPSCHNPDPKGNQEHKCNIVGDKYLWTSHGNETKGIVGINTIYAEQEEDREA